MPRPERVERQDAPSTAALVSLCHVPSPGGESTSRGARDKKMHFFYLKLPEDGCFRPAGFGGTSRVSPEIL